MMQCLSDLGCISSRKQMKFGMKKQWIALQTLLLCVFVFAACENSSLHPVMGLLGEQNMEKQVFTITAQKDTVLIGGQGTEIGIRAEAFVDLNGQPVVGAVELEVKRMPKSSRYGARKLNNPIKRESPRKRGDDLFKRYG